MKNLKTYRNIEPTITGTCPAYGWNNTGVFNGRLYMK
jgi:hypothetical protein